MRTSEQLRDVYGPGWYDEDKLIRELHKWHQWPHTGKQGHSAFITCPCEPTLIFEDETGYEVWAHKDMRPQ